MARGRARRGKKQRRRRGSARVPTFGQLAASWLSRIVRVCPENEVRHVEHLEPLHDLTEDTCTKAAIEACFKALLDSGRLGPATVNMLRSTGSLIVRDAQGNRQWMGPNPFALVRRLKTPDPVYRVLTIDEAARMVRFFRPDFRREALWMLITGTRPGEYKALRKPDVTLDPPSVLIHRSLKRNSTKTGKVREFPLTPLALELVRESMRESLSDFVFPHPRDRADQQNGNVNLTRMLRDALRRAGIVEGYRYVCRRKTCRFVVEQRERTGVIPCPRCGFKLWEVAKPKRLRFYDLRHCAATLHREAGCDPLVVIRVIGHAARNATDRIYTHLSHAYVLRELNRLDALLAERL